MTGISAPGSRRLVTFVDANGVSRFADDERATRVKDYRAIPGMRSSILWGAGSSPSISGAPGDPAPGMESIHPKPGGSVFLTLTLPPDSVYAAPDFNPLAAAEEQLLAVPGIAERMEPDAPGFHRTDTLDYVVLLQGEVWLVLDEDERRLQPGDCVIQIGARHAWQNRSDTSATLAVILLGAGA